MLFDEGFQAYLHAIDRKYLSLIHDTIEEQLTFEPTVPTKNRKPLRAPGVVNAEWEIRFGPDNRFRVFYKVFPDSREVLVIGVGIKKGKRLILGGEELDL